MRSLLFSKTIVIRVEVSIKAAWLPLQKANGFLGIEDRYRYHKKEIINMDLSPLVDILVPVALPASFQCRNNVISL